MSKVLVGLFSALIMASAMTASAAATDPVGIVDYQKLGQSISFQDLFKTKMEAAMGTSRQDMETLTKAMQEKQKQLDDKNAKITDEQKKSLTAAVDEQKKKLASMQADSQKKMMEVRTNLGNDLKKKLEDITSQVAAKHNLSLVFINSSLAYASNKVDITDELVTELAKALGVKVIPASQQQPAGMPARPNMMRRGPMSQ
jgi:Skp family chaperone for outer membrane proteins